LAASRKKDGKNTGERRNGAPGPETSFIQTYNLTRITTRRTSWESPSITKQTAGIRSQGGLALLDERYAKWA
jgi:hypothetical protein